MNNKRKFNIRDEDEGSSMDGCSLFNKYKSKSVPAHTSIDTGDNDKFASSSTIKNSTTVENMDTETVGTNKQKNDTVTTVKPPQPPLKVGKSFAETFSFLKNTDLFELPPEPKVVVKTVPKSTNSIIVNSRQRGNPILKHIQNIPWEFGEIIPDYEVGLTSCVLFLSLRYHNLNPDYIHDRLKLLTGRYTLRIILVQIDVQNTRHSLKELGKIAILSDCTLIVAWSPEEAGRYLETYKSYEHKPPDVLQERIEPDYVAKMQDVLTTIKSINKTDVITLLSTFGSLKNVVNASKEEIGLCPGFGPQKAQRLHKVLNEPFKSSRNVQPETVSEQLNVSLKSPQCKLRKPSENSSNLVDTKIIKPDEKSPVKKTKEISDNNQDSILTSTQNNTSPMKTSVLNSKISSQNIGTSPMKANGSNCKTTSRIIDTSPMKTNTRSKNQDSPSRAISKSDAVYKSGLSRNKRDKESHRNKRDKESHSNFSERSPAKLAESTCDSSKDIQVFQSSVKKNLLTQHFVTTDNKRLEGNKINDNVIASQTDTSRKQTERKFTNISKKVKDTDLQESKSYPMRSTQKTSLNEKPGGSLFTKEEENNLFASSGEESE